MEHIYNQLKERIIWLDMAPGSLLNLSELADAFRVSRTPVKESLIALTADDLVMRQGAHFVVTPLSFERVKELTEIREPIEIQANVFAMQRATAQHIAALRGLCEDILVLEPGTDNLRIVRLDNRVHLTLFDAAGNRFLKSLCERLLNHYLRFWLAIPREIEPVSFFADTLEIVRGVIERNEGLLRAASSRHIKASIDEIRNFF